MTNIKNSRYKAGLARLYSARASLSSSAILLTVIVIAKPELVWLCVMGFLAVLMATFMTSRSGRVGGFKPLAERHGERIWPRNAMKAITEALDIPVFIFDETSILRHANGVSKEVFGNSSIGAPLSFRFRTPSIIRLVESVIEGGKRQSMVYEQPPASKHWFSVECVPVPAIGNNKDSAQPSGLFLLTFTDLTQIRKTEQMRSDFIANASHELRTPLTSLRGYIETLQGPAKNDEQARERFLEVMLEQAERMSRLINNLLSLSYIEMKAHMLPCEQVDLSEILNHVKDSLSTELKKTGTRLILSGTDRTNPVTGDYDELIQVFYNLIENAGKYGRKNGIIHVSLDRNHKTSNGISVPGVEVRDDGPGIAPEHIPRLTERFYRVQGNDTSTPKGTGLGLSIVKHIVNRHGARLNITSESGKGTTVKIFFTR